MSDNDRTASVWEAILSGANAADAMRLAKRCVLEPEALAVVTEASQSSQPITRAFAFHTMKHVATLNPKLL